MKNYFSIYVFLIFSIYSFSQNTLKLDEKNGFKDFHLGDNILKYSGQISLLNADINSYKYTGSCCKDVFGNSIEGIVLYFTKNQLDRITIIMPEGQGDKVSNSKPNYLDSNFILMFGEYSGASADDETGDLITQWRGNKVILTIEYIYKGYETGWQAVIIVESMDLINSGF
jgi:hypothetical protein